MVKPHRKFSSPESEGRCDIKGLHQGLHRLEKNLNLEVFPEKSLKIISALKSTGKSLKSLEQSLNSSISIKLLCLYLVQHMLHQI